MILDENKVDVLKLAVEIIGGRRLTRSDNLDFFNYCDLEKIKNGADAIRRHFVGDGVDLCTIISGKSGQCSESCKFCAQSVHHKTGCEVHELFDFDRIFYEAKSNENEGVDRFAIVRVCESFSVNEIS